MYFLNINDIILLGDDKYNIIKLIYKIKLYLLKINISNRE